MIMYKLHVRGFTMDSGTRSVPGTFRALMNRIPYLKKLGVTTVELMPVYEFEEIELPKQQKLPEYIRWKEKQTDQIRPAEKIKKEYCAEIPLQRMVFLMSHTTCALTVWKILRGL